MAKKKKSQFYNYPPIKFFKKKKKLKNISTTKRNYGPKTCLSVNPPGLASADLWITAQVEQLGALCAGLTLSYQLCGCSVVSDFEAKLTVDLELYVVGA